MTDPPDQRMVAYLAESREKIAKYGWLCQHVFPVNDSDPMAFTYTVGLAGHGHRELIVFGLEPEEAQAVLNHLGQDIVDGAVLLPGFLPLGGQYDPYLLETDPEQAQKFLTLAYRFYSPMLAPLQLVLCDTEGVFPWQSDCEEPFALQPILGPPPRDAGPSHTERTDT